MPRLPLVGAQEDYQTPLNGARAQPVLLSPTQAPTIRANPGMRDAEFGAAGQVGEAISNAGHVMARVKQATDAAYITRSQTQMEAAQIDFQTWTKTHPDPSTWQEELDARLSATKETVTDGGKQLSPLARQHLGLVVNDWDIGTRKRVQLQATEQGLQIASASYQDFIAQATEANDLPAIESKVKEAVATGVFAPKLGQRAVERARAAIQQNLANGMIENDPFEAERALQAKAGEDHVNFPGMAEPTRQTLVFRAHKAAAQTRSNTMREWASMVADAEAGKGPMPDREGIDQEAARQGISPKWVANLFKPPTAFDRDAYAKAWVEIQSLELIHDETGQNNARAEELVMLFKGHAAMKLQQLTDQKRKPDSTLNTPVAQSFFQRATQDRSAGLFLPSGALSAPTPERLAEITAARDKYATEAAQADRYKAGDDSEAAKAARAVARAAKARVDVIERGGPRAKDLAGWETRANEAERNAEALRYSDYLSKMRAFFEKKPDATDSEAETYARELRKPYVMEAVAKTVAARAAEGATGPVTITTQAEFNLLPPGAQFIFNGKLGKKK